ncbi:MAG: hypothetical protein L6R39_005914 [Caloplaca ligustica]|nr:MAG: hypothetical protein L6R39_005914 [Caloplaca ligustica]
MRDWSRGQALGYYSIHPSHFKTRVPLHINDDDLCPPTLKVDINGYITERPRSEFTMLSYTVHALQIARFARESIDLRGPLRQTQRQEEKNKAASMRNHLNKKYENFVAQLPSHFKPGSTLGLNVTEGPMAAIPIHRWMLHQQLWSLFLRLHRASLFAPQDARAPCQLLAQNIISTQAQIQARCAVCGSLSTSVTQLFNAAVVLLVDLLFSSKPKGADHSSAQLRRLMTKDKIREAVELLRTQSATEGSSSPREPHSQRVKASAQRSAVALNALMELEEEEYGTSEDSNGADPAANRHEGQAVLTNSNAIRSLKHKVINTLEALRGNAKTADEATEQANPNSSSAPNTPWSLPTATNGFHDLDILPVLSHEPNSDFWQFLGLAPPPVQWPELEDPFGTTL